MTMKAPATRQAVTQALLHALMLALLLTLSLPPVRGEDTINSIRGTIHRKTSAKAASHRHQAVAHHAAPSRVATRHILRPASRRKVAVVRRAAPRRLVAAPYNGHRGGRTAASVTQAGPGPELLVNGDFEQGNTGFTSGFRFSQGNIWSSETYDVVSDPHLSHLLGASMRDHTSGSGLMMAVNGSHSGVGVVWTEKVSVAPQTRYLLSAWAANWGTFGGKPDPPSALLLVINGTTVGHLNTPADANGLWRQMVGVWDSGTSDTATVTVIDTTTNYGFGDNFALDDLSLRALPITSSSLAEASGNPSPAPDGDAPVGGVFFEDDFSDPARSQQLWQVLSNQAQLVFEHGDVSLKDNTTGFHVWQGQTPHFPLLRLRQNPFPATGDWECSFTYNYNKGGSDLNSDGVSIYRADGSKLLYLQQDGSGQSLQLNGHVIWSRNPNNSPKDIVAVRKLGGTVFILINGSLVGQGPMGPTPTTVELGGDLRQTHENWSNFCLYNFRVNQLGPSEGVAGQGATLPATVLYFEQDFFHDNDLLSEWDQTTNGGTISVSDGLLHLIGNGSGFPVIKTRNSPFPNSTSYTISVDYRYISAGNYGTGFQCKSANGGDIALIQQDVNVQFLALAGNNNWVWQTPPNNDWHRISLVIDRDAIVAYVDGKRVGDG